MENTLTLGNLDNFSESTNTSSTLSEKIETIKAKVSEILSKYWEKTKEFAGHAKELSAFSGGAALLFLDDYLIFSQEDAFSVYSLITSGILSGAYIASNLADLTLKEKQYLKKIATIGVGGIVGFFAMMPELGIANYLAGTSASIATAKIAKKVYDKYFKNKNKKNDGRENKSGIDGDIGGELGS